MSFFFFNFFDAYWYITLYLGCNLLNTQQEDMRRYVELGDEKNGPEQCVWACVNFF